MSRTFGANLRRLRLLKGLTQEELMRRLGLKRHTPLSLWETGAAVPHPLTIVRIAAALRCKPAELLDGVETPYDRLRAGKPLLDARARAPAERRPATRRRASSA
jgi:transcriptional regulator with XRE-family HTH domain